MEVVNIGNLADTFGNGKLPKCGMIISAGKEELMDVAGDVLYQSVRVFNVQDADVGRIKDASFIRNLFDNQISRCGKICNRLESNKPTRKYTLQEVLAIIDELLDGIKPGEGVTFRKNVADISEKMQEVTS